jgi:hypothetical protein
MESVEVFNDKMQTNKVESNGLKFFGLKYIAASISGKIASTSILFYDEGND